MTREQFVLLWMERRLSIYDLNSLVRKHRTCGIPDELGRLAAQGKHLTSEEAYGCINALYDWADELGEWPLDPSKNREEWEGRDNDLPVCVLKTDDAQYIDYNDMPRILALYDGKNLPDYLPEQERQERIRRQRHRPVLTTHCRHEGCEEEIKITVAMAARAIRAHKLIEREDVYEPSTLCKKHRAERDEILAQKRQGRGGGLKVPLGQAAKFFKQKEAKTDVDSCATSSAPVEVVEEPSPPPQVQEAGPPPQEELEPVSPAE